MKNIIVIIVLIKGLNSFGQCPVSFTCSANFETVSFVNQSTISNSHYYWNFGDGTSSYLKNPTHNFPESGKYFVTLFMLDTLSNCSAYYDYWITVTKYSSDNCQPNISDSTFFYNGHKWLKILDKSTNCNNYYSICDADANFNASTNAWFGIDNLYCRSIERVKYLNSTNNIVRVGYKSMLHQYSSSKNYTSCSANFEFSVVSENVFGKRILFKAMNKNASFYKWSLAGFGDEIVSNNDTISQFYNFNTTDLWFTRLITIGFSGCKDTLQQEILINNTVHTSNGIKEDAISNHIKIYPNPVQSILTITDEQNQLQNSTITIINTLGQTVLAVPFSHQINVSSLVQGLYYLTLQDGASKKTVKFVKE